MARRLLTLTLALLAALALVSPVWAAGGWGNDGTRTLIAEVDTFKIVTLTKFGLTVATETYVSDARTVAGQALAGDLNLGAAFVGTSTAASPLYFAGVMGNIIGTGGVSGTKNMLAGVFGKFDVKGTISSTYPAAGVVGEIGDGTTGAYAAVLAVMGGDSASTTAVAAFAVDWHNSTASSAWTWGLDLQGNGIVGSYMAPRYSKGDIRLGGRRTSLAASAGEDVCINRFAGTPTNGTTFAGDCGPGSLVIDTTNGKLYINTNTKASPTWTVVGGQS
mgnify:CR=1 FL=1